MNVLYLTEADVRSLLTMDLALEAVESAFRKISLDEAVNLPRQRCQTDHVMLHVLPAAAKTLWAIGFKVYTTGRFPATFHVHLFDPKHGGPTAILEADYLGQVRTGAASGAATKKLARPDAKTFGLFGTGKQARTQLIAVCKVRRVRQVQVYSPSEERRKAFAAEMSEVCQTDVIPVPRPEQAASEKDIVITATSSREPVLVGHWLSQGTHLNAVGSNFLGKAELDPVAIRRCAAIVVDSKDQARLEAGDFQQSLEDGSLHWSDVRELGQVVIGRYTARKHAQDITLFKSLGIALEDVTVAGRVYAAAQAAGIGQVLENW